MHLVNSNDNPSASSPPIFGVLPSSTTPTKTTLRNLVQSDHWTGRMVGDLCDLVGGIHNLENLDVTPLRDTPFDWAVVSETDQVMVRELLREIDERVASWFGDEYQVIAHRLVERIASHSPKSLSRGPATRTAAAITWLALRGNGALARSRWPRANTIWSVFRVSNCTDRARGLFKEIGLAPRPLDSHKYVDQAEIWLSDPSLLHSETRRDLVQRLAVAMCAIEQDAARRIASHPLKRLENGSLSISARSVTPRWAIRAPTASGRTLVLITFGETEDDPEVLSLSVPDARHLVTLLERALDSAHPWPIG